MADVQVNLDTAASALDGTEKFHVTQGAGPADRSATAQQMGDFSLRNLGRKRFTKILPITGSTSWTGLTGDHWTVGNLTFSGASATGGTASTNIVTRQNNMAFITAAGAGSLAYMIPTTASKLIYVGNGSGVSGFTFGVKFIPNNNISDGRYFYGLISSTSVPTNVEPSTLTNCIGIAKLAGSANLQLVYGGSAAQTPIDLGVNFPANGSKANLYQVEFTSDPNDNTKITYRVERVNTGDIATGNLTNTTPGTTLPATTTVLGPTFWLCNNGTASAMEMDFVSMYCISES